MDAPLPNEGKEYFQVSSITSQEVVLLLICTNRSGRLYVDKKEATNIEKVIRQSLNAYTTLTRRCINTLL